jgi:GxxExxY protein
MPECHYRASNSLARLDSRQNHAGMTNGLSSYHIYEIRKQGYKVETEVILPIVYDGQQIDAGYRLDEFIEGLVIVENKSVEQILPVHEAQLLTYLKLRNCKLGFLLNWNVPLMKQGIKRMVNNL